MVIKLRYNTECGNSPLFWRVLIDGTEHLAENVTINVPVETTRDFLHDKNCFKHHISCESERIEWEGQTLIVS